jgi:hypothetical protein
MKRILSGIVLAILALPAFGQTASAARKQVELSMVATGSVDIDADGQVEHYALDNPEKLPSGIVQLVSMNIPAWKFAPKAVDARPIGTRAQMSLRFVAKPNGDGNYNISIRSASFFDGSDEESRMSVVKRPSSDTLRNALRMAGATGDVYVALKIGPDGKMMDGIAQQVNLTMVGTSEQMRRARKYLGQGALDYARHCAYSVPTKGSAAGKPYIGILPFTFSYADRPLEGYGQWRAYVPGPVVEVPWQDSDRTRMGVDAAPNGALTLDNAGPKLLTPLSQG